MAERTHLVTRDISPDEQKLLDRLRGSYDESHLLEHLSSGDLTTEQWALILFYDTHPKINQYADAVLNGRLDFNRETHRQYLGLRHWAAVTNVFEKRVKGDSVNYSYDWKPGVRKMFRPSIWKKDKAIYDYAAMESWHFSTLDDYAFFLSKPSMNITYKAGSYGFLTWDKKAKNWLPDRNGFEDQETHFLDQLLQRFYLTREEVSDPKSLSPEDLIEVLKTKVPDEIIRDRIYKSKSNFFCPQMETTLTNGWEKPIPQAV